MNIFSFSQFCFKNTQNSFRLMTEAVFIDWGKPKEFGLFIQNCPLVNGKSLPLLPD